MAQRTPPWWSWSPVQRHGFCISSRPTPVASGEGVDRGRSGWVLLNNTNRPRKKLVTKLSNFIIVYTSYSTYNTPKMMVLRFPHASRSSHLPSILPSVAAAWMVCLLSTICLYCSYVAYATVWEIRGRFVLFSCVL